MRRSHGNYECVKHENEHKHSSMFKHRRTLIPMIMMGDGFVAAAGWLPNAFRQWVPAVLCWRHVAHYRIGLSVITIHYRAWMRRCVHWVQYCCWWWWCCWTRKHTHANTFDTNLLHWGTLKVCGNKWWDNISWVFFYHSLFFIFSRYLDSSIIKTRKDSNTYTHYRTFSEIVHVLNQHFVTRYRYWCFFDE